MLKNRNKILEEKKTKHKTENQKTVITNQGQSIIN